MSRAPQERACVQFGMRQADSAFQSVGADTKPVETGSPSTSTSRCRMTTAVGRVPRYVPRFYEAVIGRIRRIGIRRAI